MCGVAGIWGNPRPERLTAMADRLAHRGPDDSGRWHDPNGDLAFAHHRLSIIDLEGGRQPMVDGTGRHVLVFNGAIYNHMELRQRLSAKRSFRTVSDTEVVLQGYLEYGPAVVDLLHGMFAFALWDRERRELFLCRDPLGQKPMYFCQVDREFVFASELGALIAGLEEPASVDPTAVSEFLGWGAILAPKTIYRGVESVQPGEWVMVRERRVVQRERYWRPELPHFSAPPSPASRPSDRRDVQELVRAAIVRHLVADVPVACFLSGGIDSGLVAAIAAQARPEGLKTITVGFEEPAWDERRLARLVANHLGTEHQEVVVRSNVVDDLPGILARYGQPFGDPSAVPSYYLSQAAEGLAKVVLLGDGGDEIFGGYRRHLASRWVGTLGILDTSGSRRLAQKLLDGLPRPAAFRSQYAWAHRWLRGFAAHRPKRYLTWTADGFTSDEMQGFALRMDWDPSLAFAAEQRAEQILSRLAAYGPVDAMQRAELSSFLPGQFLVKTDIATMAHGLEARCPFLDRPLVEATLALPSRQRVPGWATKPILRSMARECLPPEVVNGPKRGLEIPLTRWLKRELAGLCQDVLLDSSGVVADLASRKDRERLLLGPPRPDPHGWARRVWLLLCLGLWERTRTQ